MRLVFSCLNDPSCRGDTVAVSFCTCLKDHTVRYLCVVPVVRIWASGLFSQKREKA